MDSLYDRLRALERIENAYARWADYRAKLTAFLLRNTERGAAVTVFGAGMCNDLDLAALTGHCSRVTLVDRDTDSVHEGLRLQGIGAERVNVRYADFVGISDAAYRAIEQDTVAAIRRGANDAGAVTKTFLTAYAAAFAARRPQLDAIPEADYAVACGVHSQLLTMPVRMAYVLSRYAPLDTDAVEARVRADNTAAADGLTETMQKSARRGIFLGLETNRVGETDGIEGARQALDGVSRMRKAVTAEAELIWPLDEAQKKVYSVRVVKIADLCTL